VRLSIKAFKRRRKEGRLAPGFEVEITGLKKVFLKNYFNIYQIISKFD